MKKFISMVMAAAMVVSLVPATAFAGSYGLAATASIVNAWEKTKDFDGVVDGNNVPELKLTVTEANYQETTDALPKAAFELTLVNADFAADISAADLKIRDKDGAGLKAAAATAAPGVDASVEYTAMTDAEIAELLISVYYDGVVPADAVAKNADASVVAAANKTNLDAWASIAAPTTDADLLAAARAAVGATDTVWSNAEGAYVYANPGTGAVYTKADLVAAGYEVEVTEDVKVAWAEAQVAGVKAALAGRSLTLSWKEEIPAVVGGVPASGRKVKVLSVVRDTDDHNVVNVVIEGYFKVGDTISVDLNSVMDKTGEGKAATVKVTDGDFGTSEEMTYVSILGKVLKASVKDIVEVAEDEIVDLKAVKVEAAVGNLPVNAEDGEDLTIKVTSKGFEYVTGTAAEALLKVVGADGDTEVGTAKFEDEDEIKIDLDADFVGGKVWVEGIQLAADTAKEGDVCSLTVYADDFAKASVEVAKVCAYKVVMELADADEDVPVIYSGVSVDNAFINDESDHMSLEVKLYETFAGAWDMDKAFTLTLPEGVYVTDVDVVDTDGLIANVETAFADAYIKGKHVDFEFAKRTFGETDPKWRDVVNSMTFALELVADPGFVGDVTLTVEGAAIDTQEVTIAKFVAPYTIKAEKNDVIIDYRYTEVSTPIVITEAEAGLWDEGLTFGFVVDKGEYIVFEDDATFTVNEESDMEIDADGMEVTVTEESEEEVAVITIDGIELFMQRNIPAGAYDLKVASNNAVAAYDAEVLLGQGEEGCTHKDCATCADVNDYSAVVKEAWINVVTAGRDKDDASFTTTVVVPVGETTMYAGEKAITLDVPAYINADGWTMLPVRAVAVALGIDNDAVQWDNATKTVIIMYGQRVITMTAGQKVIYASGTAIPAKSAVEIVDGRAFLGLRDLATALGVTSIDWDGVAKVATLNPVK